MRPALVLRKRIRAFLVRLLTKEKYIAAIFLLGLVLRLLGTYPGYPLTHPDEPTIATPAIRIAFEGDFRPQNYYYGSLLSLIYAATYIVFFIPLSFIFTLPVTPNNFLSNGLPGFFSYLQTGPPLHEMNFWSASYWARYDSAIVGSLAIVFVYILGNKLFNRPVALLTAFFLAINYRHVLSSKLILADAQAATFALLSVVIFVKLFKKPDLKTYVLSGIGMGLAFSVKYFVYVLPAFAICHLIAVQQTKKTKVIYVLGNLIFNYRAYLALIVAVIVFLIINPYFILAREEAAYYWAANSARYGLGSLSFDLFTKTDFSYYALYYLFHFGLGPILSVITIAGLPVSLFRYPKSTLIILSVAAPFVYTFLVISGTGMVRNYAAIIPFMLFFPAVLIFELVKRIKPTMLKVLVSLVVVSTISFHHLKYSAISAYHLSQKQNMIALRDYLGTLPKGSKILGPSGIFYPTENEVEALKVDTNRNNLKSIAEIKKTGVNWIILSSIPWEGKENLMLTNNIAKTGFFDEKFVNDLAANLYNTIVFNELSDYRVQEFVKPLTQDPPFMVVKIPPFWEIKKDKIEQKFSFKGEGEITKWSSSYYPENSYKVYFMIDSSVKKVGVMKIEQNTPHCNSVFSKFSSSEIKVQPVKWYSISTIAKRDTNPIYKTTRSGFFRLDFYSAGGSLIKTYVTSPLSSSGNWETLETGGLAPNNSSFAKISFSIDPCLDAETYTIDEISLFSADSPLTTDISEYKFYGKKPTLFNWLPQL